MAMPSSNDLAQVAIAQCRETTADAALKWALVALVVGGAVGLFIGGALPAYWDWKWRRKARKEGLKR